MATQSDAERKMVAILVNLVNIIYSGHYCRNSDPPNRERIISSRTGEWIQGIRDIINVTISMPRYAQLSKGTKVKRIIKSCFRNCKFCRIGRERKIFVNEGITGYEITLQNILLLQNEI